MSIYSGSGKSGKHASFPLCLFTHTHPRHGSVVFWRNLATVFGGPQPAPKGAATLYGTVQVAENSVSLSKGSGLGTRRSSSRLLRAQLPGRPRAGPSRWVFLAIWKDPDLRGGYSRLRSLRVLGSGDPSGDIKTLFPGSPLVLVPLPSSPVQIAKLKNCLTKFQQADCFSFETFQK